VLREPIEREIGKIGRAVMTITLAAATVMLILAVGSLIGLVIQRHFQGAPMHDHEAFHTANATARACATVSADNPETAASVTIGALGYRMRCMEAGCGNLARRGFRYADTGGRPMTNLVFCHGHGRLRVERDRGG
jgi:hypothetical protein